MSGAQIAPAPVTIPALVLHASEVLDDVLAQRQTSLARGKRDARDTAGGDARATIVRRGG